MKFIYYIISGKYIKFKNCKISYIFQKKFVFSIIWVKYGREDEKIFKEEKTIEVLKILGLIKNI